MRFSATTTSSGVVERDFQLGEIPGVLWSPERPASGSPLVLMGHGGGLHKKTPAMVARAREAVTAWGFRVVAVDAPGHGDRPRGSQDDQARADMRRTVTAGDKAGFREVSVRYISGITERAVPEWQAVIDAVGDGAPVGYGGGISMGTAIGIPLTAAEPRVRAAIFGGGFFVYDDLVAAARTITVPVQFLLPWDDEFVDRQSSLDLFDAFASVEKTLHANPGDHRTVSWVGVDDRFLARHLS